MKQMMMKAKAGVTLVELLVVILIVTILSVSLLPLLKPYIEEAKYAAEPIPVLANLQTKINLYQYEKDNLPGKNQSGGLNLEAVASWMITTTNKSGVIGYAPCQVAQGSTNRAEVSTLGHFASEIDVDWQDLLGRRMNPTHFQYAILKGDGSTKYGYAIGVFGDGNGLGKGTGYAVMSIVDIPRKVKIVGTWKRYKPKGSGDLPLTFKVGTGKVSNEDNYCYLPQFNACFGSSDPTDASASVESLLTALKSAGWEFNNEAVDASTL